MVRYRRSGPSFAARKINHLESPHFSQEEISQPKTHGYDMIMKQQQQSTFDVQKITEISQKSWSPPKTTARWTLDRWRSLVQKGMDITIATIKKTQHGHVSSGQLLPSWSTQRYHMFIWRFPKNPSYHLFIIFHYKPKPSINWGTPQAKRQAALKRKPGAAPWPWRE